MAVTAIEVDELLARRRLRRKLIFWRVLALLVLVAGGVGLFAWLNDGVFLPRSSAHVARVKIGGLIRTERERAELFEAIGRSGAKAVILAIDSPGGTVVGSAALYDELRRLATKKPIVAVVDGMAASGAYIAAMGADHIIAPRNALVGSIGVIFQFPNFAELMKTVGISYEEIKSTPLKAAPNMFDPPTEDARAAIRSLVEDSYVWFKELVSERRLLSGDKLDIAADGRVFTGHQALPLRLIDEIGDERTARDWLERERGIAKNLPVRDWHTQRAVDEFGWLAGIAIRLMSLIGLEDFGRAIIDPASGVAMQARLDGLLALWHPR
ncbi:signal peptide peptidase SppA [Ancylobacter pratisalsi]|uniref:Signal peptide peptidase SppA n=1 Tax=Ancylobacter pratisalsi TaxID=1745854 RepID=A0A6P1YKR8_9HYPH|nr:signal peptide peptidase SppA [Ancylobacter pratisalsi]QIB33909.1 signal peptide peptidase SppA [Ancylobacter pratisalsi]